MEEYVYTEIEISASCKEVWAAISDFENYPQWTQTMKITGNSSVGDKLKILVHLPDSKPKEIPYLVLANEKDQKFECQGWMINSLLWKAVHVFELVPIGEEKTKFINRELFSGLSIPFMRKMLKSKVPLFKQGVNEALKKYVESRKLISTIPESRG